MYAWRKKQKISFQRGRTAISTGRHDWRRFLGSYQLESGKRKRKKSKYIKYQRGGARPLLGMVGKLAGKALLNLLANKISN